MQQYFGSLTLGPKIKGLLVSFLNCYIYQQISHLYSPVSNTPLCCSFSFCSIFPPNLSSSPALSYTFPFTPLQIFFLLPLLWILKGHKNFPFSCPKLFVYLSPPRYNKIILPFRCHLNLALSPSTPSFSPGWKSDQHFLNWKSHNNIFFHWKYHKYSISIEHTTRTVFPLNVPQGRCFWGI